MSLTKDSILYEWDSRAQVIQLYLIFPMGSLDDPKGQVGLTHFVARSLFRGTQSKKYLELNLAIEKLGASIDVSVGFQRTVFAAEVIRNNFKPFLELLGEIFEKPAFDKKEIGIVKNLIIGEIRSSVQNPRILAARGVLKSFYAKTSMEEDPDGSPEVIRKLSRDQILKHYKKFFVRENIQLALVSPWEGQMIEPTLKEFIQRIPSGVAKEITAVPPVASSQKRQAIVIPRPSMSTTPFFLVVPGVPGSHPDCTALEVANFVFGADFTSRLIQVLRAQNGWTYGANSSFHQFLGHTKDAGVFTIYTYPSEEFAAKALPKTLELYEEYIQKGVTPQEFETAIAALSQSYAFEWDTAEKRLNARLRALMTGQPCYDLLQYQAALQKLSLGDVNGAIQRHLKETPMTLVAVGQAALLKKIFQKMRAVDSVRQLPIRFR